MNVFGMHWFIFFVVFIISTIPVNGFVNLVNDPMDYQEYYYSSEAVQYIVTHDIENEVSTVL